MPGLGLAWRGRGSAGSTGPDRALRLAGRAAGPAVPRYSLRREEAQLVDLAQEAEERPHLLGASTWGHVGHLDHLGASAWPAAGAWARARRAGDHGRAAHGAGCLLLNTSNTRQ